MGESVEPYSNVPTQPLRVVIIGGSIAGLMQGIMLKRLGHNVQVLERSTSAERLEGGTGITLGPDAVEFFRKYDLMKQHISISTPGMQFLNDQSEVKRFLKAPRELSSWNRLHYNLRANFDGYKSSIYPEPPSPLKGDGEAVFSIGKKATDVQYADQKVTVYYEDLLGGGHHSLPADLVIVADGASSQIRRLLVPGVQREYAGYLAWRGYVDESEVSEETRQILDSKFTTYTCKGGYILSYIIPGKDGSLERGKRRINWIWYADCPLDSPTFSEALKDKVGHVHRNYLPVGQMRPSVWEDQLEIAQATLIPPMLEIVKKATNPAISVIHDYACPKAAFFDGKVVLVGDALALFRPHAALSFNQAALDTLLFEKVMTGETDIKTWETKVTVYGARTLAINETFGAFFIYGVFAAARGVLKYLWTFLPF